MIRTFGRRTFDFSREVAVMAIINRTPDSFYDPGRHLRLSAALAAADQAVSAGADWLDVGGVRAGPGPDVKESEELRRVIPVIEAVRARANAVISIETYRPEVARRAIAAGADVINDPTGLYEPRIASVAAETGAGLVVMHYGAPAPRTPLYRPSYRDVVVEVADDLRGRLATARARGVPDDRLIIDPGHDFHKNPYHSLELTRRLEELSQLGYPLLVAVSNKDFIGETLDQPVGERLEGTLAALAVSILKGANIVRVHEVRPAVRAVRMTEAILGWRAPAAPRRGLW